MFKRSKFDFVLLGAVSFLTVLSLIIIYSFASSGVEESLGMSFFYKQLAAVVIGYGALFFLAFYDYRVFLKSSTKIYFIALALLVLVILLGKTIRGTTGWISAGIFNFQPVELVKIIMIIFLASFLSKKRTELGVRTRIIASLVLTFIPVFLILRQPDLGSSLIIIFIWIGMILSSRIGKKNIAILSAIGIFSIFVAFFFLQGYQVERLKNFVDPFKDPKGSGYNVIQSMVAVGSGGFWGKGLGHGSQSQLNFLPEKHTDFIFAAIGEELGFAGAFLVILTFLVILYRLREIGRLARDNFGYLIAVGTMILIFSQTFINIGMNLGTAPVTGVPLPFLSYGGSATVAVLILIGIILNIHGKKIRALD